VIKKESYHDGYFDYTDVPFIVNDRTPSYSHWQVSTQKSRLKMFFYFQPAYLKFFFFSIDFKMIMLFCYGKQFLIVLVEVPVGRYYWDSEREVF
jgi:hypothetical protein